jgi:hypothetical protein
MPRLPLLFPCFGTIALTMLMVAKPPSITSMANIEAFIAQYSPLLRVPPASQDDSGVSETPMDTCVYLRNPEGYAGSLVPSFRNDEEQWGGPTRGVICG